MGTPAQPYALQISAIRLEAAGVVSLELRPPDGTELPAWQAGAHLDLHLPSGLIRQYSLCSDPAERRHYRIAVLREAAGRGGSREVHEALHVGQTISVAGPRNAFALQPAPRYQFVAGGIGITPILPMVHAAQATGVDWLLRYGGRHSASMAFAAELQAIDPARVQLCAADTHGPLNLATIVAEAASGRATYACGPAGLLDALSAAFAAAGLAGQLHLERFGAAAPASLPAGQALRVVLARSGAVIEVAEDCTILAALRAAGHAVASSCEQGVCGVCETRVLAGEPEHHDLLLTEAERARGDRMMLCVSRARSASLTLDL